MDEGGTKENKRPRSVSDPTEIDDFSYAGPNLDSTESKRPRIYPDNESPEMRRIQDDLLNILDDSDGVADRDPAIQGLDMVIKSFEKEITVPDQTLAVLELGADLAEASRELGYLLEASDDELGLPPSFGSSEDEQKSDAPVPPVTPAVEFELNGSSGFENELSNYESFEFGTCGGAAFSSHDSENDNQFEAVGGFHDYTVDGFDGGDASELLLRPESLPAT